MAGNADLGVENGDTELNETLSIYRCQSSGVVSLAEVVLLTSFTHAQREHVLMLSQALLFSLKPLKKMGCRT